MSSSSKENQGAEPDSSDDENEGQIAPFETQPPPEEEEGQDQDNDDDDGSSHMMQLETQPALEEASDEKMSATSDNHQQQHHVRFPSMPTRAPLSRRTRLQSISKPTNTLQMDTLPTLETLTRDQLEYACHTVVAGVGTTTNNLLTSVLPVFWTLLPNTSRKCGRVYSRLQLAALSTDLQHADNWTADDWANAEQQLLFVRAKLLRRNANVLMEQKDEIAAAASSDGANKNTTVDADGYPLDEQLEQHDMMVHACREVLVLVRTQQLLAAFRAALLQQDQAVQDVLAEFRGRFVEAYPEGVPKELQPLVVGDLYSPKKKQLEQQPRDWNTVKDRVLEHLERVVQAGDYAIENTVNMVRGCLRLPAPWLTVLLSH